MRIAKAPKVQRRAKIVHVLAIVMVRDFEEGRTPSMFTHEGPAIAALRGQFCLSGWPWPMANQAARDIVAEALTRARAKRPGWAEGQRGFTRTDVTRDSVCRNCCVGLRGRQVSFCSYKCRSAWWRAFNAEAA